MDSSAPLYFALMLDCSDERQVRFHETHGPRLLRLPAGSARPSRSDPLDLMIECSDPRQARFGHPHPAAGHSCQRTA